MSANQVALSTHITTNTDDSNWVLILNECQDILSRKNKIKHVTLQYEKEHKYYTHRKYLVMNNDCIISTDFANLGKEVTDF
jgi:hypothetical protein